MHRYYKYAAVAAWSMSFVLFTLGALRSEQPTHYDLYAFGVFAAFAALGFTVVAALEVVVPRVFAHQAEISRGLLAKSVAAALADELEERGEVATLHRVR